MALGSLSVDAVFALALYSVCSSLMLVINKMAITQVPLPSTVTLLQLVTCVGVIFFVRAYDPKKV